MRDFEGEVRKKSGEVRSGLLGCLKVEVRNSGSRSSSGLTSENSGSEYRINHCASLKAPERAPTLTPRQHAYVEALITNGSHAGACAVIGVRLSTGEYHAARIRQKFGSLFAACAYVATHPVPEPQPGATLVGRDAELRRAILAGMTTLELAAAFGVARATVSAHRKRLGLALPRGGWQPRRGAPGGCATEIRP